MDQPSKSIKNSKKSFIVTKFFILIKFFCFMDRPGAANKKFKKDL